MQWRNSPNFFNRSPDRLGLADVRTYQIHLVSSGMAWAGFNVAVCALRFFYGVIRGTGRRDRLLDIATAMSARTYQVEGSVVIGVIDEFCPWNAGCWWLVCSQACYREPL
jgi:hypothetical protein